MRPLGTLSVDAAGRITGTDPDGTFTGTFTIVDGSKNYQRMTLSFSPNGGGAARIFSGIAGSASPNATGQFRTFDFKLIDANGTLRYGWLRQ